MNKKVTIGARPTNKAGADVAADAWVESRTSAEVPEKMKRLTIDIPESLHRDIKMQCAGRGTKIADELREILNNNYRKS
jgi:hypothetical protein